jgi:hypothetical protein
MSTRFQKLFLTLGSSAILLLCLANKAFAITFNFSGSFDHNSSCTVGTPPRKEGCDILKLRYGSFTGVINVDDSGQKLAEPTFVDLSFFDNAGQKVDNLGQSFIQGNIVSNQEEGRLTLETIIPPTFYEGFTLYFLPSATPGLNEPFGRFSRGTYSKQEGDTVRISQYINIASVTITKATPPVSIPEASTIPGIFTSAAIARMWLRRKLY